MNHYETVFILTPVLSDEQMKEAVEKFKDVLKENDARGNGFTLFVRHCHFERN